MFFFHDKNYLFAQLQFGCNIPSKELWVNELSIGDILMNDC